MTLAPYRKNLTKRLYSWLKFENAGFSNLRIVFVQRLYTELYTCNFVLLKRYEIIGCNRVGSAVRTVRPGALLS
ncbi:hypothetical protein JZ00_13650 [Pseudomonas frederiksbergensis]|uniref:Uncharacterized protein n=1 Tax=Pseudomonas frederiksbergensis TaxID=104087 RepID=A0A0B1Z0X2_9PSED|nr:hypothetical protein JZ00_13650 [Pseudomonas frederiksbergensis]